MLLNFLLVAIAILAVAMVFVVLIQAPKGRGLDASFGGGAANNLLGAAQSADLIEKLTWGLAGGIIVLCLVVAFLLKPNAVKTSSKNSPKMEITATYNA